MDPTSFFSPVLEAHPTAECSLIFVLISKNCFVPVPISAVFYYLKCQDAF
jgi:hypothetical protein